MLKCFSRLVLSTDVEDGVFSESIPFINDCVQECGTGKNFPGVCGKEYEQKGPLILLTLIIHNNTTRIDFLKGNCGVKSAYFGVRGLWCTF